jgi:hypothetical protein
MTPFHCVWGVMSDSFSFGMQGQNLEDLAQEVMELDAGQCLYSKPTVVLVVGVQPMETLIDWKCPTCRRLVPLTEEECPNHSGDPIEVIRADVLVKCANGVTYEAKISDKCVERCLGVSVAQFGDSVESVVGDDDGISAEKVRTLYQPLFGAIACTLQLRRVEYAGKPASVRITMCQASKVLGFRA